MSACALRRTVVAKCPSPKQGVIRLKGISSNDVVTILLSLGVLLTAARFCGEAARKLGQPSVLGELLAGVLLGPTVLGAIFPEISNRVFPAEGPPAVVIAGMVTIGITLFLLVAGMEVDLSSFWRQGKSAVYVSSGGLLIPFALGFVTAHFAPGFLNRPDEARPVIFSLCFATLLSISSLPVVARILMDLNIFRSDLGMIIIGAAVFIDLAGWMILALILGMLGTSSGHGLGPGHTIVMTLVFTAVTLTGGRWLIHRTLPWIHAHAAWPGGVLSFALAIGLFGAAFTEWIGVHAVFGAFIVGAAIGDSPHLREHTRTIIHQFISFVFAPLFFASIGLKLNFATHFDLSVTLIVIVVGAIGKIGGGCLGARLGGMARREAWAVGFALNIHGAMEIILGLLALEHGIISENMFVAIVVMAIVTPLVCGGVMRRILHLRHPRRLDRYISPKAFIHRLQGMSRRDVVRELSYSLARSAGLDAAAVDAGVWERESQGSTGIGNLVAVPHARVAGLKAPLVAVGISINGVDFDAPDGDPARIIFLLLTPSHDDGAQIEILADIARKFGNAENRSKALRVTGYTEFLALLRTATER